MNIKYLMAITGLSFLVSCDEGSEDKTQTITKDGSLETEIGVTHLDSLHDIITTKHKTWVGGNNTNSFIHVDTVSSLGMKKEEVENDNDETMEVTIPKDYEIFITVK
jgi:phage-related protein